jgi:hypothetical protein
MNPKDWWGFTIGVGIALYLVQTVVAAIKPKLEETIAEAYTLAFLMGLVCLHFFISSAPYWAIVGAITALLLFTSAIQRKHLSSLANLIRRGKRWRVRIIAG